MSRTHKPIGDFDVITGPPARSRPVPPASPPTSPPTSPPKPETPAALGAPPPSPEPDRKATP